MEAKLQAEQEQRRSVRTLAELYSGWILPMQLASCSSWTER